MTSQESQIQRLSPAAAQSKKDKALFLDVRTPLEFGEMHIEGSVLHPLSDLDAARVKALTEGKSGCIVVCRSGNRAHKAAERLCAAGLQSVEVLDGGVQAWDAAGLPLKRGKAVMSLERQVRIVAGALVFAGAALGYFVNPAWIALSGFVGAGLVFAGITDFCGMGLLLARMPWNTRQPAKSGA
jgi:rhodanese-related sulfurtransferase